MREYTITEASDLCQISASTLRYYEDEGLLKNIKRINNRRFYSEIDLEKIRYIKCFRVLGMSIQDIKQELKDKNLDDSGVKAILFDHLNFLKTKEQEIRNNIELIEKKLKEQF